MYNHDPFAVDPRETIDRLKTHATLVLGSRPSTRDVTNALLRYVMKDRKTDTLSMMELARELFADPNQGAS